MRARKLVSGEEMVLKSVSDKKSDLVIVSSDIEKNTLDKLERRCAFHKVKLYKSKYAKDILGQAIGKNFRVCLSIEDVGFAKLIMKEEVNCYDDN